MRIGFFIRFCCCCVAGGAGLGWCEGGRVGRCRNGGGGAAGGRDWGGARGGWGGVGMVWGWESRNREVGYIGSRGIHGGKGSGVGVGN